MDISARRSERTLSIPPKIHVTRVTHVTTTAKCPNSLTLPVVTRLNGIAYTRCNDD